MNHRRLIRALLSLILLLAVVPRPAGAGTDDHVHLVFSSSGASDDPCHTGEDQRTVPPYGRVYLTACVFHSNDQPTPASDVTHLQWTTHGTRLDGVCRQ